MTNLAEINWQKEALAFLLALSPVRRMDDINTIRKETTTLLCRHSHCLHATLIRLEDGITARVLYSTSQQAADFVDADAVRGIIKDDEIVVSTDIHTKWLTGFQLVILPVTEGHFCGALVLAYPHDFIVNDDCLAFLQAARVGVGDITKLTQVYFSAEKLTTRFNAILETIPQGIIFVDNKGREAWVNGVAAEMLELKAGNVPAIQLAAAMQHLRMSAINHADITQRANDLFRSPGQSVKDWKWIYGDPVTKVLNVSCVPAVSDNIEGRLWVFDDVTFIYQASEQLKILNTELEDKSRIANEQNMAKSEFLANMSHEIRTPMNGVIGMTSLLSGTHLTDEQRDYVETIRISGETLLSIINDILDFSKIESGKMELEQAPFSISKVIEETYDLLSVKAYEKGLDLLYYVDAGVPMEIIGDVTRFRQVLVNLVSNGLKFTEKGEVLISVGVKDVKEDIYTLEFKVKDTGIGIPADKYHRLFESFSQVDSSTTRKYGGTGLGLAICQRIIKLMGGSITVDSVEGAGSVFTFSIVVAVNKQATQYPLKDPRDVAAFEGKSVLLLDDNLTNLRVLKEHFVLWGMKVSVYDNYTEAIAALKQTEFDVTVIDMVMPGKNGLEVGAMIKEAHPALPMILYTSAAHFSVQDKEQAAGIFTSVLNKPFKRDIVKDALLGIFGKGINKHQAIEPLVQDKEITAGIRILVAEDDAINQKLIGRVLDKLGYNYEMVDDGIKAVDKVKAGQYDIVFMDVMMPEMDGVEATHIIRKEIEEHRQPYIVALTANALAGDREHLLSSGMNDFVSKPYKSPDIQNVIDKWIQNRDIHE